MAIKFPEKLDLVGQKDLELFSAETVEIINCLRKNEQNEQIDYLSLKTEVEEINSENEKEFESCIRELKTLAIKDKLDKISQEIKKAEQNKNTDKVQELVQQFNQYSKSWNDLEISEV